MKIISEWAPVCVCVFVCVVAGMRLLIVVFTAEKETEVG